STNGNNATGVKGYMELPFTPTIQFDSVQNRTAFWYYPGEYNIGNGQEFEEQFLGQYPFPSTLYAKNSVLNFIGGSGSRYVFRLNASNQTDTVFNLSAETIYLEDVAFLRTSEGKNAKIIADIGSFVINEKIFGGDATLVLQQGIIKIDSLNSNYQIMYSEPLDSSLILFDIKKLYSNQIKDANKSRLFATASKGTTLNANTYVKINDLQISNTGPLWISNWNGKDLRKSTETFEISNALVIDTTNNIDTLFNVNAPGNAAFGQTNSIEFIGMGENTTSSRENTKTLKIGNLKTDKSISIRGIERKTLYFIDINSAQMEKRRLINISNGFSLDTCAVNISCNECISTYSTPISNFNTDATTTVNISGKYTVQKTGMPVIYTNSDIYLENAQLINDGVTPAIIAGSAITVYVRGDLYMNSDSIHPNVTFEKIEYGYQNPTNSLYDDTQTILNNIAALVAGGTNLYTTNGALTGNRTVTGSSFNLDFVSMGNLTATGAGSATYRFNLYPSSSLPLLLEQTSAGDTAYLQLRASLGRATLRATQDIYLEAANGVFVSPLEGSSTGIVSARPTGELIRREEAFFNAYFISDTITVAASETEINSTFLDAISPSFTVSGDSIIYTGTDTAYFDLGYYTEAEILESATGTYLLELSCYKNGLKIFPSESWHKVYFTAAETEPVQSVSKRFTTQLVTGDVLNIRQNGTAAISAAIHNFSFTGQKIQ
ncbi:MAG: hypothetical protein KDC97_13525, partial [Confluentibacter sp.]|nr:hypothetical protein [Confluentibacter sp.]